MKTLGSAAHYAAPVETRAAELAAKTGAPVRRSDRQRRPPGRRLAVMAAGGFAVIVVFELALAFGAPLGAAAWGGEHSGQHADLHLASVVAAAFWTPLR